MYLTHLGGPRPTVSMQKKVFLRLVYGTLYQAEEVIDRYEVLRPDGT